MRTAVQLRLRSHDPDDARSEVLGGAPCSVNEGKLGPVALFESGEVVAYLLHRRRRARVFVFRTLDVDDRLAATVPGVSPRVRLLFEVRTPGRIRRTRALFAYLVRTGHDPSGLVDEFYIRVGAVLNGRLPAHRVLLPLLQSARRLRVVREPASKEAGGSQ
jgi:hypothetical protein